jgi:hypothetical protein
VDRTLSWLAGASNVDAVERALTEVDAAIAMVALGIALSVRLCNLAGAEEAAFDAAARAQAAGITFSLLRDGSRSVTMIVGPRLGDRSRLEPRPVDGGNPVAEAPA